MKDEYYIKLPIYYIIISTYYPQHAFVHRVITIAFANFCYPT